MPLLKWIKKVIILGSGAIKIGEAGEFDYSGAQAVKALQEEGVEVVLVNPNIATIQTDLKFVDKPYFLPITPEYVEEVIKQERPDGILLGFGGQTALNCGVELEEKGILGRYRTKVLGTGTRSIQLATDRDRFKQLMKKEGIPIPESSKANTIQEAVEAADKIGYPVMIRVAYTLGGRGSGVAYDEKSLLEIVSRGLAQSRVEQVLVEEYLDKWKEVEYEVIRDSADNCVVVCNMENLDPMGIHTGDSIVVAPSQTLNNREYHGMRSTCFKVVRALGIVGECNVQFALNNKSGDYKVIEVNSRLSRSSALASKATGYPIAYVAAKLALGYILPELVNKVTGVTRAFFEPALDYVVVKMPRWDFSKFKNVDKQIGTQMKSVGEVMSIGRNFKEALQKAVRMLNTRRELTDALHQASEDLTENLRNPSDDRLYQLAKAIHQGFTTEEIHELTGIDPWFIHNIAQLVDLQNRLTATKLGKPLLQQAKKWGFSDQIIGAATGKEEQEIRQLRRKWGVTPVVKQIDTLAAEWPAQTNYLYTTYNGDEDDIEFSPRKSVIVLGSGCYRIGSSVEFDWCCVNMVWALKDRGVEEVIMVNCNPETVSTDFDVLDKLYFEELTLERILDLVEKEAPLGVVVSVGGQIPNNLALSLEEHGVKLLGTAAESIDRAEKRSMFSKLLDHLGIDQPKWEEVEDWEEAKAFAEKVGYPVIIRPSYVLSGSAMNVAGDEAELSSFLEKAFTVSRNNPVVVSKFVADAKEVEVDAVSDGENVYIGALIEHVENAGVHSGDATMSIPTLTLSEELKGKIRDSARKIAQSLNIQGPFNIQYLVKNGDISIIECNLRASRSMPFVSKAIGVNLMEMAADALLGKKLINGEGSPQKFWVKAPQFSFMRLVGADPVTGVEMVSTGEVACSGDTFQEALLKALTASGVNIPLKGDPVLITVGGKKDRAVEIGRKMFDKGFEIFATEHTAEALRENGVICENVYKVSEGKNPDVLDLLMKRVLKLVINTPSPEKNDVQTVTDGYLIRRKAVEFGVPIFTNLELASQLADAL